MVTEYRTGREDDKNIGETWWGRAKMINVNKVKQVALEEIDAAMRDSIGTF